MKQILTKDRTVFIHDFDGVHYPGNVVQDMRAFLAKPKAEAAAKLLPDLAYDDAFQMGIASFLETHDGQLYYAHHAEKLGMDVPKFRRDFHTLFHVLAQKYMEDEYAHLFAMDVELNQLFEGTRNHVRHGILTQSCVTGWASPFLTMLGRLDYFDEACRLGFVECDFETKAKSTRPLQQAITAMNAAPEQVVFIEDTLANIERAKALDPRILTVHVHHGDHDGKDIPDFVDLSYNTLTPLLRSVQSLQIGQTCQPEPMQLKA